MPYTYGQNPWVIEIEDPTTLFLSADSKRRDVRFENQGITLFPDH